MTQAYRARWVLPISGPPIRDGWVLVDGGRIVDVGQGSPEGLRYDDTHRDTVILPGLVNAHTHLELSYLHERIPATRSFGAWVREIIRLRQQYPDPADSRIIEAARRAIDDARAAGTALFGDVSNTLVTVPLLREAGFHARVFYELLGFTERQPEARVAEARARANAAAVEGIPVSLAPHAPYSVSAALFKAIRADLERYPGERSSVHLGETPEEVELLTRGTGEIRDVLQELGRWPEEWSTPGAGPVEYLQNLGVLDSRMLAVHGVQFGSADLAELKGLGTTVVSCPRSNVYVGVGSPPLAEFYASGVRVAFGTDSLASVADLDLFSELREARRIAPGVSARQLLESATLVGATALGFGEDYGTIQPGKRAALIAVRLPAGVTDVEEYLVSESRLDLKWLADR